MLSLASVWLAWLLDSLAGDPVCSFHPVRLIGALCLQCERVTRKWFSNEKTAGVVTSVSVFVITGSVVWLLFEVLFLISPVAVFIVSVFVLYTSIAAHDLIKHSKAVYNALQDVRLTEAASLHLARSRVGMIVGRDTTTLNREGIVRACVESVSESMSDGVVAPIFWAFAGATVFGEGVRAVAVAATCAMLYKAANTMDSMFGYKNERYQMFGWFSARFDDLVNYLPARLSGLALTLVSSFMGQNGKGAWRILRRDARNHASPNSGFPEAAMAGALGLVLGGPNYYFGKLVEKPTIGDPVHHPEAEHIHQANRLMSAGALASMMFLSLLSLLIALVR